MLFYYLDANNKVKQIDNLEEYIRTIYTGQIKMINKEGYDEELKKVISRYANAVPLYDIKSNHIFLIDHENVYQRIFIDNYKFIDPSFVTWLQEKEHKDKYDLENLNIISFYDLDILRQTYLEIFYESFITTNYITSCRRPSFQAKLTHITPYYDINEINYLAIDYDLIDKITLNRNKLDELCDKITNLDIDAGTLISHQLHIYQAKMIGLIKYYSLQGSFFINQYLRAEEKITNQVLEIQINLMMKLICKAPKFKKAYTVYRFINNDDFMGQLMLGDTFEDNSFMSTTRNPFYYNKKNPFGTILIKIKLPKDIEGIGICIESYSNFPIEEEIILPPSSVYRLDSIDTSKNLLKFQEAFGLKVTKKYQMSWVGNGLHKSLPNIKLEIDKFPDINFLELLKTFKKIPIADRFAKFMQGYVTRTRQFMTKVQKCKYIFNVESYKSTDAYQPFFKLSKNNGIMINTINPNYGNINLLIEIDVDLHVNYYFRYSITDTTIKLNQIEWLEWLIFFACSIGKRHIIIYPTYSMKSVHHDNVEDYLRTRYIYPENVYLYLKEKKKFYQYPFVIPNFEYYHMDQLFNMSTDQYILITDKNELHRISKDNKITNLGDLYLWIVENQPNLIEDYHKKMEDIFEPSLNPFHNLSYKINPWQYLYEKNMIPYLPSNRDFEDETSNVNTNVAEKYKIPKFLNRLRNYLMD